MHGGSVDAESEPGVETRFTVRLPMARSREGGGAAVGFELPPAPS